jgi:hypothetical protein
MLKEQYRRYCGDHLRRRAAIPARISEDAAAQLCKPFMDRASVKNPDAFLAEYRARKRELDLLTRAGGVADIEGVRIVRPSLTTTKFGWVIDVMSDWKVPAVVIPWSGANHGACMRVRSALEANPTTRCFDWSVRLRPFLEDCGDSIFVARLRVARCLPPSERRGIESRARFVTNIPGR